MLCGQGHQADPATGGFLEAAELVDVRQPDMFEGMGAGPARPPG